MKLHTTELAKEFAAQIKSQFPDINSEDVETACNNIFNFIRKHIKNRDTLPIVRIKHLGKFSVTPGTIIRLLSINENRLKHKAILPETYEENKEELLFFYDQLKNHGYNPNREILIIDDEEEDTTTPQE